MTTEHSGARLVHGWERGFTPPAAAVLGTLAGGYRRFLGAREWLYEQGVLRSRGLGRPVIAIGNLTVGGTGKTPAVEMAVQTLLELGHRPVVVSRGYRRQSRGVQIVADTSSVRLDAEEAGDEPFLLARRLPGVPVIVGSNRYLAARLAISRFPVTAIVLDDGFQHRTLDKDLEVVMVRAHYPWGNGQLLPGGPLREPLSALARAQLIVATGAGGEADLSEVRAAADVHAPGVPVLAARHRAVECWEAERMRPHPLRDLAGARVLAFAGIAAPAGFEATLGELGVETAAFVRFADHYWYKPDDLRRLEERAASLEAIGLVPTEKDWVRLRRLPLPKRPVYVVSVRLELSAGHAAWRTAFERACPRR